MIIAPDCFLTLLIQEELVESQATRLFADEAVNILGAVVVNGDGIFQRLNARLQTERDLGVADSVSEEQSDISLHVEQQMMYTYGNKISSPLFKKVWLLKASLQLLKDESFQCFLP